jgi:hypothetical protein
VANFDYEYGKMAKNFNKDATSRAAKPKDKDYSISDGHFSTLTGWQEK